MTTDSTPGALRLNDQLGVVFAPGVRWRDKLSGSEWEIVEMAEAKSISGAPWFWCRPVKMTLDAMVWRKYARGDGCVEFCGDGIAASLIDA